LSENPLSPFEDKRLKRKQAQKKKNEKKRFPRKPATTAVLGLGLSLVVLNQK
jgi:hypothetical protein